MPCSTCPSCASPRTASSPTTLTPLTVGVVALVDGALTGQGRIEWSASGTRSTGTFSTADMKLAAPFGPVEGLSTTIDFTDLLGLTSAPGQEARIRLVRAGIDVYDGYVRYQLRPNYHVAIETARWPLAGGTLTLEPTVLDFSQESIKYLTFRIDGPRCRALHRADGILQHRRHRHVRRHHPDAVHRARRPRA